MYTQRRSTARSRSFTSTGSNDTSPLEDKGLTKKGGYGSTGPTNVYRVSTTSLKTDLERMRALAQTRIDDLNNHDNDAFNRLAEILALTFYSTEYTQLIKMVEEVFEGYNGPIIPGTVGAHFRGCFTQDNFGGDPACSAVCAGSVQPPQINGASVCSSTVASLDNNGLKIQNSGSDRSIIIHILNGAEKLTASQIASLEADGYKEVTIYRHGTSGYSVKQQPISIEKLKHLDDEVYPPRPRPEPEIAVPTNSVIAWVLIGFVILVLIGIGFMAWRKHKVPKNPVSFSPQMAMDNTNNVGRGFTTMGVNSMGFNSNFRL